MNKMKIVAGGFAVSALTLAGFSAPQASAETYYKNCNAAWDANVSDLQRTDPGYRAGLDGDNDGVACEWSRSGRPGPAPKKTVVDLEKGWVYGNCTAAREAGDVNIKKGEPGYGPHLDRDDDGVGCEFPEKDDFDWGIKKLVGEDNSKDNEKSDSKSEEKSEEKVVKKSDRGVHAETGDEGFDPTVPGVVLAAMAVAGGVLRRKGL